eukprot:1187221-Prorocentrum_minimum.AAC.2
MSTWRAETGGVDPVGARVAGAWGSPGGGGGAVRGPLHRPHCAGQRGEYSRGPGGHGRAPAIGPQGERAWASANGM